MEKLPNNKRKQTLLDEINSLRKEMVIYGTTKGLTNKKTIEISQKLDIILNKYQLT
ncbi:Spo0E like sporulation regulatory protein [Bacillus freudenreichii]|nr:Spo0E like sporulation regulatory protein [Bacillus freudenreichii]